MGIYINRGNLDFTEARNSEYIDKSGLISVVNKTLFTRQKFSCVTRCRRFGKSMAAQMLCAYYDHTCDSRHLFEDLKIAKDNTFEQHLNKYPVIYLDMTDFITRYRGDEDIVRHIDQEVRTEIQHAYPDVPAEDNDDLMALLQRIVLKTQKPFFFIVDEWDAICREFPAGSKGMDSYVNWLRRMFKSTSGNTVFAGVYMTGILPIKKYKTESALNNFQEYSMVSPRQMAGFFGFTKEEVRMLAEKYGMDFNELEKWYDGYQIGGLTSIFNPNSVMQAIYSDYCESYWGKTGATDAVASYIRMNYEGLKDDIISMLAGARCKVDPKGFKNDLTQILNRDDVLTVLIHLGYLSYDRTKSECYIPNLEVAGEMEEAIKTNNWKIVIDAVRRSEELLQATLEGDAEAVARGVEAAHDENTSILSYNNENSLACVLSIAYFYARNNYVVHRELPTGKGNRVIQINRDFCTISYAIGHIQTSGGVLFVYFCSQTLYIIKTLTTMNKQLLTKTLTLAALMLAQAGGAKAQSFGSDDVISTTTLWTFDQYQAGDNVADGNFAGLYLKAHNTTDKLNTVGQSAKSSTFGDKTVYALNFMEFAGGRTSSFKTSELVTRKASGTIVDCASLNIGTPGKLYLTASAGAADRTIDVFMGNTGDITSNVVDGTETGTDVATLKIATLTTTGKNTAGTLTVDITKAGTYWITGSNSFRIYALKFVPTTEETTTKTITMSNMGLMTFSDTHAWTLPSGLKAYAIRSAVTDGKLTFREITGTIPACMGVILQGTHNQEYTLTLADASSWNFNTEEAPRYVDINYCFRTVLTDYALQPTYTGSNTWNNYILAKEGENMVLAQSSGSGMLAAGKAYFSIRTDQIKTTSGARSFTIDFDGEETTGVSVIENAEPTADAHFNLSGQRVESPAKGLYIVNGKKVIIK